MKMCENYCEKQTELSVCFCLLWISVTVTERQMSMYALQTQGNVKCLSIAEKMIEKIRNMSYTIGRLGTVLRDQEI